MIRIVTALSSAAVLTLLGTVANADCVASHKNVTASTQAEKQVVAMSTVQEPVLQPAAGQTSDDFAAAEPACADEKNNCPPATE